MPIHGFSIEIEGVFPGITVDVGAMSVMFPLTMGARQVTVGLGGCVSLAHIFSLYFLSVLIAS
jgi:hypothetical protein